MCKHLQFPLLALFSASPSLSVAATVVVLRGKGYHPLWDHAWQELFKHHLIPNTHSLSTCHLPPPLTPLRTPFVYTVESKLSLLAATCCPYIKLLSSQIDLQAAP